MGQHPGIVEREQDGVFFAEPSGAPGAPRIVIAPEIFGLTPWVRSVARRLAREGFRAASPDIFAGAEPLGADRASWMQRMRKLDLERALNQLQASLDRLGEGGRTACIGFCLGGALSLLVAARGALDACVDCYGRPRWLEGMTAEAAIDAAPRIACPVLAVYGKRDAGIPLEAVEELRKALPPKSEVSLYDAGHAFLNDTRPDMYVAAEADKAWAKITGFLRRTLS